MQIVYTTTKWDPRNARLVQSSQTVNPSHQINRLMKKNDILISIDAENAFDEIQYPFIIKSFRKPFSS